MGTIIYANPLATQNDIKDFVLEGKAHISFPEGAMRMENALSAGEGQKANYVLWCPVEFPDHISISWDFKPITSVGLSMLFFAARGINGEDIFSNTLMKRTGPYDHYHNGDINAYHVSYYRRKEVSERAFHVCNLRKSKGLHLVAQGADPLPEAEDTTEFFRIRCDKNYDTIRFLINDLPLFEYHDDGQTYGPVLTGGKIGFRQLAPLVAEYKNLEVRTLN